MTREMYESLKVTDLRAIAKQRGLSVGPRVKKAELIDMMQNLDDQAARGLTAGVSAPAQPEVSQPAAAAQQPDQVVTPFEQQQPTQSTQGSGDIVQSAAAPQERSGQSEKASEERPRPEERPRRRRGRPPKNAGTADAANRADTENLQSGRESGAPASDAIADRQSDADRAAGGSEAVKGEKVSNEKGTPEAKTGRSGDRRRGRPAKDHRAESAQKRHSEQAREGRTELTEEQHLTEVQEHHSEENAERGAESQVESRGAHGQERHTEQSQERHTDPAQERRAEPGRDRRADSGQERRTEQTEERPRRRVIRTNTNSSYQTSQNYSSQGYNAQNYGSQNYGGRGYNGQNYNGGQSYNPQNYSAQNNTAQNGGQSYGAANGSAQNYGSPVQEGGSSYNNNSSSGQEGSTYTGSSFQNSAPQVNPNLAGRYERRGLLRPDQPIVHKDTLNKELDSGEIAHGILEVMPDGFGFIRSSNYMPGEDDVYVAPSQIRRFNLKTGDILEGNIRVRTSGEKFSALLFVKSVNGLDPEVAKRRFNFEDMTPIFPDERIRLEQPTASVAMRVMDLFCPVGKGQRGMIVSPPKAGKTTLVKEIAKSVKKNNPEIHLIILLIDERPEEVTDIREALEGPNVEVIYSTFDELPEHHKRVSEMTIERAKRLVEQKQDVMILLDSITRLTRAYNLTEPSSGRTLTGGLDPVALHAPKRFFGAARNMREGGSLTILATALIETGSKMDDVVYEEFKGTGNMEVILNRKLSERRIFPAIDLAKSGTRRDDLLLTPDEVEAVSIVRRAFIGARGEEATDSVLDLFSKTRTNGELVSMIRRHAWSY